MVFIKSYQPFIEYKNLSITLQKDCDNLQLEQKRNLEKYETLLADHKQLKRNYLKIKERLLGVELANHKN